MGNLCLQRYQVPCDLFSFNKSYLSKYKAALILTYMLIAYVLAHILIYAFNIQTAPYIHINLYSKKEDFFLLREMMINIPFIIFKSNQV